MSSATSTLHALAEDLATPPPACVFVLQARPPGIGAGTPVAPNAPPTTLEVLVKIIATTGSHARVMVPVFPPMPVAVATAISPLAFGMVRNVTHARLIRTCPLARSNALCHQRVPVGVQGPSVTPPQGNAFVAIVVSTSPQNVRHAFLDGQVPTVTSAVQVQQQPRVMEEALAWQAQMRHHRVLASPPLFSVSGITNPLVLNALGATTVRLAPSIVTPPHVLECVLSMAHAFVLTIRYKGTVAALTVGNARLTTMEKIALPSAALTHVLPLEGRATPPQVNVSARLDIALRRMVLDAPFAPRDFTRTQLDIALSLVIQQLIAPGKVFVCITPPSSASLAFVSQEKNLVIMQAQAAPIVPQIMPVTPLPVFALSTVTLL